jgi:hypothetical protein
MTNIQDLPIYIIGCHGCSPSRFGSNEESTDFPTSRYFVVPEDTYIIYFNSNAVESEGSKNIPFIKNLYDYNPELFYYMFDPQYYEINLDKTNINSYRNPDFFKNLPFFSNFNYICNIEIYPPGVPCPFIHLSFSQNRSLKTSSYFEGITTLKNIEYTNFGDKINIINTGDVYYPYDDIFKQDGFIYTSELFTKLLPKKSFGGGIYFISACRAEFFQNGTEIEMVNIHPVERNCGDIQYDLSVIENLKQMYPDSIEQLNGVKRRTLRRNEIKHKIDAIIILKYPQNNTYYQKLFYEKIYELISMEGGEKIEYFINFKKINIDCSLKNNTIGSRLDLLTHKFSSIRNYLKNNINHENINIELYTLLGYLYRLCFYYLEKYNQLPSQDVYLNFIQIINSIDLLQDKDIITELINNELELQKFNFKFRQSGGNKYRQKYLKYKQKYLELKGGFLQIGQDYKLIESIGFEFESGDMSLFYGDVSDNILRLTPFGYNENSTDSSQNRSLIKVNLNKIETQYGIGKCVMSQDSYELFDKTKDEREMDIFEALTEALNQNDTLIKLNDKKSDINNIRFNIDSSKNLTFGDTELMFTFLSLQNKTEDMIINITDEIFKFIENIFDDKNMEYLGNFSVNYTSYKREYIRYDEQILEKKKQKNFNLVKLTNYKVNDKDIYILIRGDIKNNYNKYIYWTPQVTFGTKLENFTKVLSEIVNYIKVYSLYDRTKEYIQFIESLNLTNNLVENYLLMMCLYIYSYDYRAYIYEDGRINIHKFFAPVLPRQYFYEIHKYFNFDLVELKTYDNMIKIVYFSINRLRKLLELPKIAEGEIERYLTKEQIINITEIDKDIIDLLFKNPNDNKPINNDKIKLILINQIKSLTSTTEIDLFNTFTTKIPFSGNVIFEFRDLNNVIHDRLYEIYKEKVDFASELNTLNTFRFLNNYNKLKKSDSILNDNIEVLDLFNKQTLNQLKELTSL